MLRGRKSLFWQKTGEFEGRVREEIGEGQIWTFQLQERV
jgi:hypothetical protein